MSFYLIVLGHLVILIVVNIFCVNIIINSQIIIILERKFLIFRFCISVTIKNQPTTERKKSDRKIGIQIEGNKSNTNKYRKNY